MTTSAKNSEKTVNVEELKGMPFATQIKTVYTVLGLIRNDEVFNYLKENGLVPEEADEKKYMKRVANAMWAVRTPEDAKKVGRSGGGGRVTERRLRLTELVKQEMSNTEAWEQMHKDVADGAEFEAPNKKWVIDTAWAIKKKLKADGEMDENGKMIVKDEKSEETSTDSPKVVKPTKETAKGKGNGKNNKADGSAKHNKSEKQKTA